MDPDLDPKRRQSIDNTVAISINHGNPNHKNIFNEIQIVRFIGGSSKAKTFEHRLNLHKPGEVKILGGGATTIVYSAMGRNLDH
jgi:hypothetical protein